MLREAFASGAAGVNDKVGHHRGVPVLGTAGQTLGGDKGAGLGGGVGTLDGGLNITCSDAVRSIASDSVDYVVGAHSDNVVLGVGGGDDPADCAPPLIQ